MSGKIVNILINLGSIAILARLLSPKEFGIYSIILGFQTLLQPLLNMGLGPVYIKKKVITAEFTNALFTLNILLGLFNISLFLLFIPVINNIYQIDFTNMVLLFCISIIFVSLTMIYNYQFMREKNFFYIFLGTSSANFASIFVTITCAYYGFGVWSLIIKIVSYNIFLFLIYFFIAGFKYKFVTVNTIKKFMHDLNFGIKIFFNNLINGFFNATDRLIFGNFFGFDSLGNYNNAKQLAMLPDNIVRLAFTKVLFVYFERADSMSKREKYLIYYGSAFLISSIIPLALYFWGEEIVEIFLGTQWKEAKNYITILSIFSLGIILKNILTRICMHENLMDEIIKYNLITSILIVSSIFILSIAGMEFRNILIFMSYSLLGAWLLFMFLLAYRLKEIDD